MGGTALRDPLGQRLTRGCANGAGCHSGGCPSTLTRPTSSAVAMEAEIGQLPATLSEMITLGYLRLADSQIRVRSPLPRTTWGSLGSGVAINQSGRSV